MCEFMDKMPFLAVLLQSFPESILLFSLGCAVWGMKLNFTKIIPAAAISALVSWGIRALPFPFGVHSLIGIVVLTILFLLFFRMPAIEAVVATLFSLGSLLTVEVIVHPFINSIFHIQKFSDVWKDVFLRIVVCYPLFVLLILLLFLMLKFDVNIKTILNGKLWRKKER